MKIKITNYKRSLSLFKNKYESVGKDAYGNLYYEESHFALRRVESKSKSFIPIRIPQEHSSIVFRYCFFSYKIYMVIFIFS